MEITNSLSDSAALQAIGARIARYRLNRNLTQAQLAQAAGVSLSTVNRIESGNSSQCSNLVRILRALDLLENMELLVPEPPISPLQQAKLQGKTRQRARSTSKRDKAQRQPWTWDLPAPNGSKQ